MTSYPLIHSSASEAEDQFNRFVERHAVGCDALYETDSGRSLPGDTVRITVSESRHTVEFMSLGADGHWQTLGRIGHSLKEVQATGGDLESTFEIAGPGFPDGEFEYDDVEQVVQVQLEKLRGARLLPLQLRPPSPSCAA